MVHHPLAELIRTKTQGAPFYTMLKAQDHIDQSAITGDELSLMAASTLRRILRGQPTEDIDTIALGYILLEMGVFDS